MWLCDKTKNFISFNWNVCGELECQQRSAMLCIETVHTPIYRLIKRITRCSNCYYYYYFPMFFFHSLHSSNRYSYVRHTWVGWIKFIAFSWWTTTIWNSFALHNRLLNHFPGIRWQCVGPTECYLLFYETEANGKFLFVANAPKPLALDNWTCASMKFTRYQWTIVYIITYIYRVLNCEGGSTLIAAYTKQKATHTTFPTYKLNFTIHKKKAIFSLNRRNVLQKWNRLMMRTRQDGKWKETKWNTKS